MKTRDMMISIEYIIPDTKNIPKIHHLFPSVARYEARSASMGLFCFSIRKYGDNPHAMTMTIPGMTKKSNDAMSAAYMMPTNMKYSLIYFRYRGLKI